MTWYLWVAVAALFAVGLCLLLGAKKAHWNTRSLANAAMCMAIGFVLGCIKLWEAPSGGAVTPASMLPLIMFCLAAGWRQGLAMGFAYGLLTLLQGAYIIHPVQMLLDYPLAYAAIALCCIVHPMRIPDTWKLPVGALFASVGRLAMAVLSGVCFFADAAGEEGALLYSIAYNFSYMAWDFALCLIVACIPGMNRLWKMLKTK